MVMRIFFAGTEGTGKTSCIRALAPKLAATHQVLIPDPESPALLFRGNRRSLLGLNWTRTHRHLRRTAQRLRLYPLLLITNFAMRILLSCWFENRLRPDVVLFDGDLLVHPVAYARYHFPPARLISPRLSLRFVAALSGVGRRATIFHLARPPAAAAARIKGRSDTEAHVGPARNLRLLSRELEEVAAAAKDLNYEVLRIDTGERSPEQIAQEIVGELRRRIATGV